MLASAPPIKLSSELMDWPVSETALAMARLMSASISEYSVAVAALSSAANRRHTAMQVDVEIDRRVILFSIPECSHRSVARCDISGTSAGGMS